MIRVNLRNNRINAQIATGGIPPTFLQLLELEILSELQQNSDFGWITQTSNLNIFDLQLTPNLMNYFLPVIDCGWIT